MRKRGWKLPLSLTLVCANLAFIWGNSLLPGTASAEVSGQVMLLVDRLFALLRIDGAVGMVLLRKTAHFTEFMLLGLNFCWLFLLLKQSGIHRISMPLLCGSLAACLDETIQLFVPGRGSSLVDVWIDIGGVTVGIMLLLLGQSIVRKHQKQHFGG